MSAVMAASEILSMALDSDPSVDGEAFGSASDLLDGQSGKLGSLALGSVPKLAVGERVVICLLGPPELCQVFGILLDCDLVTRGSDAARFPFCLEEI